MIKEEMRQEADRFSDKRDHPAPAAVLAASQLECSCPAVL